MRTIKITFYILTFGLLFSCTSADRQEKTNSEKSIDFKTFDTSVTYNGYWVCQDYYDNIKKYKSPKKAQDNSEFIFIPDRTLKTTVMIYNFHEGGPLLTILKKDNRYQFWETQDDSLIQNLNDIEPIAEDKIKIGRKYFLKINLSQTKDNYKILEEILFKGEYTNQSGDKIVFKNSGEVFGLGKFKFYVPNDDYYDEGMQVDQIGLGQTEKEFEWHGFKFNSDTLEIFKLNCAEFDSTSNNCGVVEYGQLEYKVWSIK